MAYNKVILDAMSMLKINVLSELLKWLKAKVVLQLYGMEWTSISVWTAFVKVQIEIMFKHVIHW